MNTTGTNTANLDAVRLEIRKIKETAERMANGDYPDEADRLRSVAGLVHHLAEQTERLVPLMPAPLISAPDDAHDREVALEEDRSPERGPSAPLDGRTRWIPGGSSTPEAADGEGRPFGPPF